MMAELASLIDDIEANYEHVYQLQAQRHPFHDDPSSSNPTSPGGAPSLPSRLPLKRRLAEYKHSLQSKSNPEDLERFTVGLLAIERFRDLAPSFVVALFEDSFVIEPGDVGPIPYGHPVASQLVWAINKQQLTPAILAILGQTGGAQFYDGCLVVGLVDYRKQAFGSVQASGGRPSTSSAMGLLGAVKNPSVQPEMHKILLKPTYQTLVSDIDPSLAPEVALEVEAKLLLATSGPVCLDPSPAVGAVLQQLHYDRDKVRAVLDRLSEPAKTRSVPEGPYSTSNRSRLALATIIETNKSSKKISDAEPYYGLDVKKDPLKFKEIPPNTPLFGWVQQNQRLWRTIRFESRPTPPDLPSTILPRRTYYTLHILLNMNLQNFDVIFRYGSLPFTSLDGETRRFSIGNKPAVDIFIERFQQTMLLEGNVCVGDVSNPTVFTSMGQPIATASLQRSLSRNNVQTQLRQGSNTGPFVNILPPGQQPPPRPKH